MSKHTPTPWKLVRSSVYDELGNSDTTVCDWDHRGRSDAPSHDDAEFIVRACNAHDDLTTKAREACDAFGGFWTDKPGGFDALMDAMNELRVALANAKPDISPELP